jgi:hypothetical protein
VISNAEQEVDMPPRELDAAHCQTNYHDRDHPPPRRHPGQSHVWRLSDKKWQASLLDDPLRFVAAPRAECQLSTIVHPFQFLGGSSG